MREKIPAAGRKKGLLEGLVRSLRVCLFVGKQIGAHCRPYRLGDSEKMVGLESWRTLCCCLRWRLCFLLRRRNYCPRVEGYAIATLRHFLLLGVVFSSPSKQRNGVFLFSSASMPPIAAISFSRKTPCVGVSSSVAGSPSSPSGSKNRMVRKEFRKVVVAKCVCTPLLASLLFFSSFCFPVRGFSADSFWPIPHKGLRTPHILILEPTRMQVFHRLARIPLVWGCTRWFFLPSF